MERVWDYPRPPDVVPCAVEAQPGDFYGGWITAGLIGPFKGRPGTFGW